MFRKLLQILGVRGARGQADHGVDRIVANMGGSADRLGRKERRDLTKLTEKSAQIHAASGTDQLDGFLDNLSDEMKQMDLMRKTGAFERGEAGLRGKAAAVNAVFHTGFAIPPALQTMLDALLLPDLADPIRDHLREALVFRPIMPPQPVPQGGRSGLSFCGGLPMAPKGLIWPRYTDDKGQQRPAHFIGQVDCAEIPDFGLRHLYPSSGILFFFYPLVYNGYSDLVGDLVVHLPASDEVEQVVPSAQLAAYKRNLGPYQHFWLHELAHPHLPPGSVLPKWQLDMGVGLQLDVDKIPPEVNRALSEDETDLLDEAGFGTVYDYLTDFAERMARDPAIASLETRDARFGPRLKDDDGFLFGFDGFPHNFHAMHSMLGGYCGLLDDACKTLKYYIAFVDDEETFFHAQDSWMAPEHHQARKAQCLATLDEIAKQRQEVEGIMEDLSGGVLSVATSEQDRRSFWELWRMFSSQGPLKLECHQSDKWMPYLNHANGMNRVVEYAVAHSVLATVCNGAESFATLPEEVAQDWVAGHRGRSRTQRFLHQSMGYAPSAQGAEEEGIYGLPLMQFPDEDYRDFTVADCGALQYWIDLADLERQDFSQVRANIGN